MGVVVGATGDGEEGGGGQGQGVGSMLCVSSGGADSVGICKGSVEHPSPLAFLGRRREGIIGDAMLIRQSSVSKMQIPLQTNVPFILSWPRKKKTPSEMAGMNCDKLKC